MKKGILFTIIMATALIVCWMVLPTAAQENPDDIQRVPAEDHRPLKVTDLQSPEWGGTWQFGPDTGFQFTRFDGEYYPGDGMVYFLGGRLDDGGTDGSIWSFDPVAGTYSDMGVDLVTPVSNYTINLVQDQNGWGLYTLCGRPVAGGITNAVQVYYPDTNTAVQLDPADNYPGSGTCTSGVNAVYENKVYVAGGFDGLVNYAETWVFDPMAAVGAKWTQIATANLSLARAYIMSAVVDDLIYAIGGNWYDASGTACGDLLCNEPIVEVLDPNAATPVWDDASVADLPESCSSSRAWGFDTGTPYRDPDGTSLGGKIISGCGFWADENNHVYVYDSGLDYWEPFPYIQTDRRDHAAAFIPVSASRDNGIPGLWIWGGRKDLDTNVLISSEYYDLQYFTGECSVLLVDDDWDQYSGEPYNGTGTYYYTSTLESLGYTYDRWDVWTQGDPSLVNLQPYDAVVWFTGYAWDGTITTTNEADLAAYLDGGGNLFVTAEDYLYEMGVTAFGTDYLGIGTFTSDTGETDPVGNAGDPVGDGLGPFDLVVPTSWPPGEPMYTDYADPAALAGAPFSFLASGENNSTDKESGTFKSVFFAWPFEGLDNLGQREVVMQSVLEWFGCQPPPPPGMALIPPFQAGGGIAGATVPYTMTVVNNLGWDETFTVTYSSVWPVTGPLTVGPVANNGTLDFNVEVEIPPDLNCYESDSLEILAVAQSTPAISDTAFIETSVLPAGVGDVVGQVLDANTGEGIEGAYVYIELGDDEEYTWTNTDGEYQLNGVSACGWDGQFEAMGYYGQSGLSVDVLASLTTTLDVSLDAAIPELSENAVSIELVPDSIGLQTLSLSNLGTGNLTFHITEVPDDAIYPSSDMSDVMPTGIDPQVYEDIRASVDGTASFIVYMAEQADLSAAFDIADWNARGQYVLNALKATAERSQADLKASLSAEGVPFESRYIVNAIVVHGDNLILSDLSNRPDVAYIGPNAAIEAPEPIEMGPSVEGTDTVVWNIEKVRANEVWADFDATGSGIVVSNIDTGVLYTHTALVNQYRGNEGGGTFDHNYNWWDPYGYGPTEPYDWHSHGSHTMGTMLGDDGADNQIGMAPEANWMACQGFDQNTGYGYNAELLECAEFILAPWDLSGANPMPSLRPHVVNNSWGGGQAQWWYNQAVYAWRAAGIFGVFSAGNEGPACETAGDPGDMPNMLAVGATDVNDVIAAFSSRGPGLVTGLLKPNVSAPGVGVISAYNNGNIGSMSGTSMAAPHVAGEAALLWSAEPALIGAVDQTYWIIEQSAFPITTTEGCGGDLPDAVPNNTFGWGRIDAYQAVSLALSANWDIPWLSIDPQGGEVLPGESIDITLTFDTTGLEIDACYSGSLELDLNDPYVTETMVPVDVCIIEPVYPIYLPITFKP